MDDLLPIRVAVRALRHADSIGDPVNLLSRLEMIPLNEALLVETKQMGEALKKVSPQQVAEILVDRNRSKEEESIASTYYQYDRALRKLRLQIGWDFEAAKRAGAERLFLALLQQLALPNKLRRQVEKAAQFYSRTRVRAPKGVKVIEAYEKFIKDFKGHLLTARTALKVGKAHGEEGEAATKLRAGPFTVVNAGGFDSELMDTVAKVVKKAASLLQGKGLGKVCYGNVLMTNTVGRSSKLLAFYMVSEDEVLIRANLKGKEHDTVRTLIHELGHRLYYKFLSRDQKTAVITLYRQLSFKESDRVREMLKDPANRPDVGDTYQEGRKKYEVTNVTYDTVFLQSKDDPRRKGKIKLVHYLQNKGLDTLGGAFVSGYAKKDPEENFSEMLAEYCLGRLSPDQVKLLEPILS